MKSSHNNRKKKHDKYKRETMSPTTNNREHYIMSPFPPGTTPFSHQGEAPPHALGARDLCLVSETRRAPFWYCRDARVNGLETTAMHEMSTPPRMRFQKSVARQFAVQINGGFVTASRTQFGYWWGERGVNLRTKSLTLVLTETMSPTKPMSTCCTT